MNQKSYKQQIRATEKQVNQLELEKVSLLNKLIILAQTPSPSNMSAAIKTNQTIQKNEQQLADLLQKLTDLHAILADAG